MVSLEHESWELSPEVVLCTLHSVCVLLSVLCKVVNL